MKISKAATLALVVVAATLAVVNCKQKSVPEPVQTEGVGERTGAAMDRAADKTAETARDAAEKSKAAADKAVEKTGEALEKAGAAVEQTGEDLQK